MYGMREIEKSGSATSTWTSSALNQVYTMPHAYGSWEGIFPTILHKSNSVQSSNNYPTCAISIPGVHSNCQGSVHEGFILFIDISDEISTQVKNSYCKPLNVRDVLMFVIFAMEPKTQKLDIANSHFQEWLCTSTRTSKWYNSKSQT